MPTLPAEYITILTTVAPVFSRRVWLHVQVMLLGAILAPGQRTVTAFDPRTAFRYHSQPYDLMIENAMLRQQLIVLNRHIKRPPLTNPDQFRLVLLSHFTVSAETPGTRGDKAPCFSNGDTR